MSHFHSLKTSRILFSSLLCLAILAGFGVFQAAEAQTGSEFSTPVNLSNSGAASEPRLVIDPGGRVDVLWQDAFAGVTAVQRNDGQWSEPVQTAPPFEKFMASLKLVAGPDGLVHAAWLNEKGNLFYSQARSDSFTIPGAWAEGQILASAVVAFDLSAGDSGAADLVYIRAEDAADYPTGVYTLRMANGTISNTRLIYTSPYFRSLTPGQAQASITTGEQGEIYVAWDEPPREQVLMAVSSDTGKTWSEPRLVDRRQAGDGSVAGPANPRLATQGGQALLVWQAGHEGNNCAQYSQYTSDGGQTWSEAMALPAQLGQSCAATLQFMTDASSKETSAEYIYLLADSPAGVQLLAWQGGAGGTGGWSDPRSLNALSNFTNPQTYRSISLACLQGAIDGGNLLVAGCENTRSVATEVASGDIWLFEGGLEDPAAWYPAPTATPLWSTPAVIDSLAEPLANPLLVADNAGRLHALWTQPGDNRIFYALWDGARWTAAQAILQTPGQSPADLTATYRPAQPDGTAETLFVAWSDPQAGGLYYSLAPAGEAFNPAKWEAPQTIPNSERAAAPQALVKRDGRLALAYVIPFNEGRGVYLVESGNPAKPEARLEWSPAEQVFDAVAANWESPGAVRMATNGTDGLTLTWQQNSLPPESESLGLYAAYWQAGEGWSEPEKVTEGNILWSQVIETPDGELHRAWQQNLAGQAALFHQTSSDQGKTWSQPDRLADAQGLAGLAGLAIDSGGRVHLLEIGAGGGRVTAGQASEPTLRRWLWQGGAWQSEESQTLRGVQAPAALSVAAPPGGLAALYNGVQAAEATPSGGQAGQATAEVNQAVFFVGRLLDDLRGATTPRASETPRASGTPEGEATRAATTTPRATATPEFSREATSGGGQFDILIFGAIPALLLVAGAFFVVMRRLQGQGRR